MSGQQSCSIPSWTFAHFGGEPEGKPEDEVPGFAPGVLQEADLEKGK